MKTSFKILVVLMAFIAVWSACQFDIVNALMSMVSIPLLFVGYNLLITLENETKK